MGLPELESGSSAGRRDGRCPDAWHGRVFWSTLPGGGGRRPEARSRTKTRGMPERRWRVTTRPRRGLFQIDVRRRPGVPVSDHRRGRCGVATAGAVRSGGLPRRDGSRPRRPLRRRSSERVPRACGPRRGRTMWRATRRRARVGPALQGPARGLPRGVVAVERSERPATSPPPGLGQPCWRRAVSSARRSQHRADAPSAPIAVGLLTDLPSSIASNSGGDQSVDD